MHVYQSGFNYGQRLYLNKQFVPSWLLLLLSCFNHVRLFVTSQTVARPARLLCPWDSPGKNTGVSCNCLLQTWLVDQANWYSWFQFPPPVMHPTKLAWADLGQNHKAWWTHEPFLCLPPYKLTAVGPEKTRSPRFHGLLPSFLLLPRCPCRGSYSLNLYIAGQED